MRQVLILLASIPTAAPAAAPPPLPGLVRGELRRYYADQQHEPPWRAAVKRLSDREPTPRVQAANYLRELLAQTKADEKDQMEPWEQVPYQLTFGAAPAHQFRSEVASELAEVRFPPEGEQLLQWFLESEPDPVIQAMILPAFANLSDQRARVLCVPLVTQPHPNAAVVIAALDRLRRGNARVPEEVLISLCNHPRASIREAARRLNKELGRSEPTAFNPTEAMQSERIRGVLNQVREYVTKLPPLEAKFVRARWLWPGDSAIEEDDLLDVQGWLLGETNETVDILDVNGKRRREKKPRPLARVKPEDQFRLVVQEVKVEELVRRLEQAHRERLTSLRESQPEVPFDSSLVTWDGLVIGWWLDARGQRAEAARVLLPILDGVHRDDDVMRLTRSSHGYATGLAMLDAFIGDRDYARAEKFARVVDTRFAGTRFHAHARRLLVELPLRREDFTKLKLPRAEEWNKVRLTMPRAAQIDYLCRRVRLLNCFQASMPGWIVPTQTQYAEARKNGAIGFFGLSYSSPREVINPYKELTDPKSPTRVRLADVPQVASHLADDWSILALGYGRLIAPSYVLLTTRPLLAKVINGAARKDVCQVDRWSKSSARERRDEIARIVAWAKANENKSEIQLEWQALDEEIVAGAGWYTVKPRLVWLLDQKQGEALKVLPTYLLNAQTSPHIRADILELYDKYAPNLGAHWRKQIPWQLRTKIE